MDNESVIRTIKLSERIAWAFVISIITLIVFFLISKNIGDWSWFARSGSLLVCIGVLTASYDIKGRMEKTEVPETFISQAIIMEALIVIVGTIVWGFGDLLSFVF